MTAGRTETIELWRQRDGYWRWRYVAVSDTDGAGMEVVSSRAFPSSDDAAATAGVAYPGVPIETRVSVADRLRRVAIRVLVLTVAVWAAVRVVRGIRSAR
jgi:hypothetical protein